MSFEYHVIKRPRRKTVSISVQPDCSVRLLVPANLPDKKIRELVKQKSNWIESKIAYFKEIQKHHREKEYISGECFTYLGRNYRLKIDQNTVNEEVKLVNGRFTISIPSDVPEDEQAELVIMQLSKWYQKHAVTCLEEKVRRYATRLGVSPISIGVKKYKSRWGSCHADGRINFNWRIIMAPHFVVDYVVVHELCHLVHHNHSKKFWNLVETILPDHTERRAWLKLNGSRLKI